jgi:hypothetical protein
MPVFICAGFQDSSADFSDCPIKLFDCADGQGEEQMVPETPSALPVMRYTNKLKNCGTCLALR